MVFSFSPVLGWTLHSQKASFGFRDVNIIRRFFWVPGYPLLLFRTQVTHHTSLHTTSRTAPPPFVHAKPSQESIAVVTQGLRPPDGIKRLAEDGSTASGAAMPRQSRRSFHRPSAPPLFLIPTKQSTCEVK